MEVYISSASVGSVIPFQDFAPGHNSCVKDILAAHRSIRIPKLE